ncbi:two-component regulator propeller domain-containing protein [Flavihumibacter sp. CACIAM 22H1]|uniref:ligand-binding sensor domain-containing protein n=1 Tax=Flavihumibacter sp. CACIAM 22H1 TaxID=1812911 RepID=UPI0007A7E051|nr:two-component regulator propeller domain-containing protein [Flavihumibacter sp. CACIAM 22H1]KYP15740.1 MAG: hypothetical protein A1D16_05200 [Flavihumibacter sp. CACIAM 22H1]
MNSLLFSLLWLFISDHPDPTPIIAETTSSDSLPANKQPVDPIRLWPGPLEAMKKPGPSPEEFQISAVITQVMQDRSGGIWMATADDGVCYFDGTEYHYFRTSDGLAANTVRTMVQDASGTVWIATSGGISRQNANGFTSYTTANGLPDNDVFTLHIDRKGMIWAGTRGGLAKFEKDRFLTVPLYREPKTTEDKPIRTGVNSIYEDKSGQLWFGTNGYGLFKYDGKTLVNVIKPGC